jgi:NADPH:quinone reductase-like Zn-dependent oxidoreductase
MAYREAKDLANAKQDFSKVTEQYARSPAAEMAWYQLGLIAGIERDPAERIRAFESLIKWFPQSQAVSQAWFGVGSAAYEREDWLKAQEALQKAIRLDPERYLDSASQMLVMTFYAQENAEGLAEARSLLKKMPVRLAANAVGGESAIRLMDLLSPEGKLVTYGAMSRQSLKVPNKFLIFKSLELHGLWISKWIEKAGSIELYEALSPLAEMMRNGDLAIAVDQIYPMSDFKKAVLRAQDSGRSGKVILDLSVD